MPKLFFEWVSLVTLITCSVEWVQLSSLASNEKTSWYSAKGHWVESTRSGGHDSNPLRSNSWNNFSCLCFMVSLGIGRPCASSNASITLVCMGGSGTHVTVTALVTRVFFVGVLRKAILFLTTMATACYHHTTLFKCSAWSGPGVRTHLQHEGPESCLTPLLCEQSLFLAYITWDKKASRVLVFLGVTTSLYSLGCDSPATTLSFSTVAVAH